MGIPVDDDYMRRYLASLKIEERRRELAAREQEDYSVFVSYSHADKSFVRRLTAMFDRRGIRYLIDEKELQWTHHIATEVRNRIEQSTHYLLVLSPTSVKSQWCAFEFGVATQANKSVCLLLASVDVAVPPFAQGVLATPDLAEVEAYFSRRLIDPETVDGFIAELLGDAAAPLDRFDPTKRPGDGRRVWRSPSRDAIEQQLAERSPWVDYTDSDSWAVLQIELDDERSARPLLVECVNTSGTGSRPITYAFSYNDEVRATIVEPRKHGSESVGVWEEAPGGERVLRDRMPTLEEQLKGTAEIAYGWACSRDFWDVTLERLATRLPKHADSTEPPAAAGR